MRLFFKFVPPSSILAAMKNILLSAVLAVPAFSAVAAAQEPLPLHVDLEDPAPASAFRPTKISNSPTRSPKATIWTARGWQKLAARKAGWTARPLAPRG